MKKLALFMLLMASAPMFAMTTEELAQKYGWEIIYPPDPSIQETAEIQEAAEKGKLIAQYKNIIRNEMLQKLRNEPEILRSPNVIDFTLNKIVEKRGLRKMSLDQIRAAIKELIEHYNL